jgi:membrane protein DedA with SNARE-associated domain
MTWIGDVIRILGVVTVVYAIVDAVLVAAGQNLDHKSQLAWVAIAAAWAVWGIVIIWPRRF